MYYNDNFKLLEKTHPYLADQIKDIEADTRLIQIIDTDIKGIYSVRVYGRGGKTYLLHSAVDPFKEAFERINHNLDNISSYYNVAIGFGFGYYIRAIKKRMSPKGHILVIIPRLDIFKTVMTQLDLKDILEDNHIRLIAWNDKIENELRNAFIGKINQLSSLQIFESPNYEHIIEGDFKRFRKTVIEMVRYSYFQMGNSSNDTLIGIRNILRNIKYIIKSPSLDKLRIVYKNNPAILVSAGPSLDKNIKHLKAAQGKALIISAATSAYKLMKNGIIPDFIMNIERDKEMFDIFFSKNDLDEKTVFCGDVVTESEIFANVKGKCIVVTRETSPAENWISSTINEVEGFDVGSSVAHIGFGLAENIGCNPIILIGQDLSFGEDGKNHANNTIYDKKSENYKKDVAKSWDERIGTERIKVKGNYCDYVYTIDIWKKWIKWFEMRIRKCSTKVINATEGGAYIDGTELMTLEEALMKYCNNKLSNAFELLNEPDAEEQNKRHKKLKERICNDLDLFKSLKSEFNECIKFCDLIINTEKAYTLKEINMIFSKVIYLRDNIHTYSKIFAFTIQALHTFNCQEDMKFKTLENTQKLKDWLVVQKKYFEDISSIMDITIELYHSSIQAFFFS